jgi:regulator of protease activity HflC (stomatin/prohibitin superfamily)
VRELFSNKREEFRQTASNRIAAKLGAEGIVVKEVVLRDIELPGEYAKGLEGLLLKEQENERMNIDLEVKKKLVQSAELEAEAQKAREVTEAEARAQVVVLEAKAQADAMQHTLPLKEKQIQQSRLEAEARKEATVKNAEAMAEAKVIDGKAELEKRRLMSESDEYRIRRVASADAERMKLEAEVLKENPLLIQKIIAEKLSDKVQIMMVPNDGKFFFANDVLKGTTTPAIVH